MKTKTTAYRLVKRYSGGRIAYLGFPSYEAAMKFGRRFQDPRIGEIYHPEEYWGEVFRDENGEERTLTHDHRVACGDRGNL